MVRFARDNAVQKRIATHFLGQQVELGRARAVTGGQSAFGDMFPACATQLLSAHGQHPSCCMCVAASHGRVLGLEGLVRPQEVAYTGPGAGRLELC